MNTKTYQLGIIGLGHMGLALAKGCISGKLLEPSNIAVFAHSAKTQTRCKQEGLSLIESLEELVQNSRILLLAVPPKNLDEVLKELAPLLDVSKTDILTSANMAEGAGIAAGASMVEGAGTATGAGTNTNAEQEADTAAGIGTSASANTGAGATNFQPCILSVVAGRSIKSIQDIIGAHVPVAHALPNATLQVGLGACALCFSDEFAKSEAEFIKNIFSCAGIVYELSEELINASVAAHGSTPAYVYYFVDCMIKHLISCGFEEQCARELLVQTIAGSAKLMQEQPDKSIASFINEIATEGGTTAAAINMLKNSSFADDLAKANNACIDRCNELAK